MVNKVYKALQLWDMLSGCKGVIIGLSGGADSVSLLHIMREICAQQGMMIRAVHINHGIRGQAADEDEQFCRSLCQKLQLPLDVFRLDIPSLAKEEGTGLEECGRIHRYECFERISREYDLRIATAHTLSDSAESMLLNIARGCGTAGLRGIPAVRGRIIRPLILASRDDIEQYCADNNLEYVTDQTNFDDCYSRNHVRLNVIPALRKLNPEFLSAAARLMESAREDDAYLSNEAQKLLESAAISPNSWQANILYSAPSAVKKRALIQLIQTISGKSTDFTHVQLADQMLENGSGAVTLPCGKILGLKNGILCETKKYTAPEEWCCSLSEAVTLPDGRRLTAEIMDCAEFVRRVKKNKSLFKSAVNCDIIDKSDVFVRRRRSGDRFAPSGRGVTKTLKKLFNESRVERTLRDNLAIIECDGKIIWIEGFGAAEGYTPSDSSQFVTIISVLS